MVSGIWEVLALINECLARAVLLQTAAQVVIQIEKFRDFVTQG